MDFKAAIDALKKLDNGAELASAVEAEVDRLNGKNYEVIGEKRTVTTKAQTLETALVAIAKAVGLEGDVDAILSEAQTKVQAIATEADQLRTDKTALETRATEAEGKVQQAERKTKLSQVAAKAGAAEAVLEKLLGDKLGEIAIADDGVKLGDKSLREYVEADETLKVFLPALFPNQNSEPEKKQAAKLPSGSPNGGNGSKNPADSYMQRTYAGINKLVPKPSN